MTAFGPAVEARDFSATQVGPAGKLLRRATAEGRRVRKVPPPAALVAEAAAVASVWSGSGHTQWVRCAVFVARTALNYAA